MSTTTTTRAVVLCSEEQLSGYKVYLDISSEHQHALSSRRQLLCELRMTGQPGPRHTAMHTKAAKDPEKFYS